MCVAPRRPASISHSCHPSTPATILGRCTCQRRFCADCIQLGIQCGEGVDGGSAPGTRKRNLLIERCHCAEVACSVQDKVGRLHCHVTLPSHTMFSHVQNSNTMASPVQTRGSQRSSGAIISTGYFSGMMDLGPFW
jgi:hypothetical protein